MSSTDSAFGIRNMTDKATYERLERDVTAVKNDIYKDVRANAEATLDDMSERGSAMMGAAQDAASSIEESLEEVITQRPLATVGLALGLGFLIGVTWRR